MWPVEHRPSIQAEQIRRPLAHGMACSGHGIDFQAFHCLTGHILSVAMHPGVCYGIAEEHRHEAVFFKPQDLVKLSLGIEVRHSFGSVHHLAETDWLSWYARLTTRRIRKLPHDDRSLHQPRYACRWCSGTTTFAPLEPGIEHGLCWAFSSFKTRAVCRG